MERKLDLLLEGMLACSGIPGFAVRVGWRDEVMAELARPDEHRDYEDSHPAARGRRFTP